MPTDEATTTVSSVMHRSVYAIESDVTLRAGARRLRDAGVGAMAIVRAGSIVAIVSERDIVHALADGADPDQIWIGDVMTDFPRSLTPDDSLRRALELMLAAEIRHLPVVDRGQLVGIVSIRDLAGRVSLG